MLEPASCCCSAGQELNGRGGPGAVYCCLDDDLKTSAAAAAGKLEENGAPRREVIAAVHPELQEVCRKPIPCRIGVEDAGFDASMSTSSKHATIRILTEHRGVRIDATMQSN